MLSSLLLGGFKIFLMILRSACADAGPKRWASRLDASKLYSPGLVSTMEACLLAHMQTGVHVLREPLRIHGATGLGKDLVCVSFL